jgi:uroporphyrinogen-III synthase
MTLSLAAKRIVITRAAAQSGELTARLEALGATVLALPAISFRDPDDTTDLDRAIAGLDRFDWIVFTSANAARFFARRCGAAGRTPGQGRWPRSAAVGPATAGAVAEQGFTVDYTAQQFRGAALGREMAPVLAGKRVLLPRSDRAGRDLPEALRAAGAEIVEVVAYRTGGMPEETAGGQNPALEALRATRVDAVCFFSPSAVDSMIAALGHEVMSGVAAQAAMVAIGPVTAAALRAAGLEAGIEAEAATVESVVQALTRHFSFPGGSPAGSQARSL